VPDLMETSETPKQHYCPSSINCYLRAKLLHESDPKKIHLSLVHWDSDRKMAAFTGNTLNLSPDVRCWGLSDLCVKKELSLGWGLYRFNCTS
jgi:hypothetical protein